MRAAQPASRCAAKYDITTSKTTEMEQKNMYMAIAYKMYTTNNEETTIEEETDKDRPFQFITGFGLAMPAFEEKVATLATGDTFDFALTADEAFGAHYPDRIVSLDRDMFTVDGRFDHEHIYLDAMVPLKNEDGNVFMARVLEIGDDKVTMDLNHPLAGKDLHFTGTVLESREATNEEIQNLVNHLNGGGCCGGGCGGDGGCGGGCGHCSH